MLAFIHINLLIRAVVFDRMSISKSIKQLRLLKITISKWIQYLKCLKLFARYFSGILNRKSFKTAHLPFKTTDFS